MTRHVLSMTDLTAADINEILDASERPGLEKVLAGRGAALIFEHPSARTRNASEMAVFALGGHPVTIRAEEIGIDQRESAEDVAMTLSGYHAMIGARVARHATLTRMTGALDARGREVPVVNLLSDVEHPSQALADLLTIRQEFGRIEGLKVAFIGDANNVARSLAFACALTGADFRIASPEGIELSAADLSTVRELGGKLVACHDAREAAAGADVLYSDVWVSMGEESEAEKRDAFSGFTIDDDLLELAAKDAIVLHCLPAHRGEEVTASVIDGPRSRIWRQAENRMHALRGLIHLLFSQVPSP